MDLAVKDVQRHLGKFAATIVGVGLLLAIVLIMNGIYEGNIGDGVWLIDNVDTDLWIVERNRGGPFNEQSRMPEDAYKSVAATPGVAQASPFITYAVQREVGGRSQQFTIIGYDVFGGLGGPGRIVAGRTMGRAHYEMVADQKLGLKLGQTVRLGVHDYTVVGLTKGAVDSGGNPLAYLSLPDAQEVLYQQDNRAIELQRAASLKTLERAGFLPGEAQKLLPLVSPQTDTVSAVLVRLAPGADPRQVTRRIEDWLYYSVYTTAQERDLMLQGRLKKMTAILETVPLPAGRGVHCHHRAAGLCAHYREDSGHRHPQADGSHQLGDRAPDSRAIPGADRGQLRLRLRGGEPHLREVSTYAGVHPVRNAAHLRRHVRGRGARQPARHLARAAHPTFAGAGGLTWRCSRSRD